jgi:hypothetical protein
LAGSVEDKFGWAVLQTYDQATGRLRSYPKPGVAPWRDAVFYAIDGHTGYWGTLAGVYEVDLDSGDERPLTTDEEFRSFELYSVQNGVLAFRRDDSFFAGASVDRAKEMIRRGDDVLTLVTPPYRLSPTGAWLSLGVTQLEKLAEDNYRGVKHAAEVYNTSTGAHITLDVMLDAPQNTALAIPVLWLDDVTVQVVAVSSDVPFDSQPASVHADPLRLHRPGGILPVWQPTSEPSVPMDRTLRCSPTAAASLGELAWDNSPPPRDARSGASTRSAAMIDH